MGTEPEVIQQAFDYSTFMYVGGVITMFGVYVGAVVGLKNWIIKGLTTLEIVKEYLNDPKEGILVLLKAEQDKQVQEVKDEFNKEISEIKTELIQKNTKWLGDVQKELTEQGKIVSKLEARTES